MEKEINSKFSALSNSINFRRKTLIEEAKRVRDRKLCSLNQVKETVLESQKYQREHTNRSSLTKDADRNTNQSDNSYGIHEPWGNNDVFSDPCNAVDELSEKKNMNKDEKKYELEEGNMSFTFDSEDVNFISTLGKIEENLSSPKYSRVEDLGDTISFCGDILTFKVRTCDVTGRVNVNSDDKISIRVYDGNKNKLPIQENDMDVLPTPITVSVYVKSDLTFE